MNTEKIKKVVDSALSSLKGVLRHADFDKRRVVFTGIVAVVFLAFYVFSHGAEKEPTQVFHRENKVEFDGEKSLGTQKQVTDMRDLLTSNKLRALESEYKQLSSDIGEIKNALADLKTKQTPEPTPSPVPTAQGLSVNPPAAGVSPGSVQLTRPTVQRESINFGSALGRNKYDLPAGPKIITFPVKGDTGAESVGVVLPAGSYVRAKLLTGVMSPEGRPLPVLLQADYNFVGPNSTTIDLSGCFLIAKSTANMSLELVEMQATKLSCVSKSGKMFEREINAFVADQKENSFAVPGEIVSKQDDVAKKAFLASVVAGIGRSIQQKQTSSSKDLFGNTSQSVSGSDLAYAAAGGASEAASLVTSWYLKKAEALAPTIKVVSGQDVWVVLQDKVSLPNWYFQKSKGNETGFSYLSGILN